MNDSQDREADIAPRKNMPDSRVHELWRKWTSNKKMRWTTIVLLIWAVLAAVGPCTITHKFGPYYGKTVDAETGEPIEGAVVLVAFNTVLYTPAGYIPKFVDALEVVTNANGEFRIPVYRSWVFRTPHGWNTNGRFIIFKPGYGNFPWHMHIMPKFSPVYTIPHDEYVVMRLPKIRNLKEAEKNLNDLPPVYVPRGKMPKLLDLIEKEYAVGSTYFN